ncbi:hypothetical protein N7492_001488 [Penicillium capsulatum]|uniref:AB hydrolase-1 domain-containing protein n=1 Tax=Penicillium capsulatum TaxID=69766 RepID=A0A9W9ITR7_9EURO|nr:hypothetical protein N7492_001488 [Penicillium capsulatum]KAJ6129458.1 hypothetical protein N7512_002238 [Penicillium capsulatum]
MAAIAFPQHTKSLNLSTGYTYSYVYIPATSVARPTLLFLHGFPSSCWDWRHQISFFASVGYGILAPDLLGYGGTSKPTSAQEYNGKRMSAEIAEILDVEDLQRVHAVAHDTGCILLSRLANYHPDRLLSCTFLAVPYSKPGEHFDLDAVNATTKQILGKERFGYIRFFTQDGAGAALDENSDSFFSLFYPADHELWNDHLGPTGAVESWLQADRQGEKAPFITDEERAIHHAIMRGQHGPALMWYRMLAWNLNEKDEVDANLSPKIACPVLMVFSAPTASQFPTGVQSNDFADDLTVRGVSTSGHWLQLEARDEVNTILKGFFER